MIAKISITLSPEWMEKRKSEDAHQEEIDAIGHGCEALPYGILVTVCGPDGAVLYTPKDPEAEDPPAEVVDACGCHNGWDHFEDPKEIEHCQSCSKLANDSAAVLAHRRECGCGWPEYECKKCGNAVTCNDEGEPMCCACDLSPTVTTP